jgi:MarR family transcriptional regulator for hemolysin
MKPAIAYIRVSTARQGKSGLGMEAQQEALARFAAAEGHIRCLLADKGYDADRDGLIESAPDPADGRSSRITLTEIAKARLPDAVVALLRGNREGTDRAVRWQAD